jgi:hypothetical protein
MATAAPRPRRTPRLPPTKLDSELIVDDLKPEKTEFTANDVVVEEPPYRPGKFNAPVKSFYNGVAKATKNYDPLLGGMIAGQAEVCAKEWDKLARTNPAVKKALEFVTGLSGKAGLLGAHLPIILYMADKVGLLDKNPLFKALASIALAGQMEKMMAEAGLDTNGLVEAFNKMNDTPDDKSTG